MQHQLKLKMDWGKFHVRSTINFQIILFEFLILYSELDIKILSVNFRYVIQTVRETKHNETSLMTWRETIMTM